MAVIPPKGTSAYNSYIHAVNPEYNSSPDGFSGLGGKIPTPQKGIDRLKAPVGTPLNNPKGDPATKKKYSPTYSSGGSGGSGSTPKKKKKIYYEAPIAKKYGFGRTTAYQEALANTAYRREMEDMRKAGLNPSVIYGDHNTSGAASNIYPREESSGGSGGSGGYGRRSGRSNSGKYLFSGGAYYGLMAAAATITALATGNVGAGMAAAGITGTALKAFNGFFSK